MFDKVNMETIPHLCIYLAICEQEDIRLKSQWKEMEESNTCKISISEDK
ncbi:hypothetical protein EMIT079MI2_40166 [Bacillus sp. IT-79MI2]